MEINVYPEKYTVKSTTDEMYCKIKLTSSELNSAMDNLTYDEVSKWSMAIGQKYEGYYDDEFIYNLSKRLLPQLKKVMIPKADKEQLEAIDNLIKYVKERV